MACSLRQRARPLWESPEALPEAYRQILAGCYRDPVVVPTHLGASGCKLFGPISPRLDGRLRIIDKEIGHGCLRKNSISGPLSGPTADGVRARRLSEASQWKVTWVVRAQKQR
jgi:hypothetical protein